MKSYDYIAISQAEDLAALKHGLTSFAHKLGFELVNALLVENEIQSVALRIGSIGNTPDEFRASHADLSAIRSDPVLNRLMRPTTPFAYDQAFYVQAGMGHLWEEQAPYGYKFGLAASLGVGPSTRVLVGVDGPDPLPVDEEIQTRLMADLQLMVVHAHVASISLLQTRPVAPVNMGLPELSRRELQVLAWAAQGKSTNDTAAILGLSQSTVKKYMQSILEKFGVSSKIAAVRLATAFGMLG